MAATFTEIRYEVADRIATITLDRPHARNGLTITMANELAAALDLADRDEDVRAAVMTGVGEHFCVGADLSGGNFEASEESVDPRDWQEPAGRVSKQVFMMRTPVIAAMRGAAVGGGLTITLACDFRLGSTDSKFGLPFARRGIFPEGASVWHLPRLVGLSRATDWMVTGRIFEAREAQAAGLLTSVHEPEDVLESAHELARGLRDTTAPVSVGVIRQMLQQLSGQPDPSLAHQVDSRLIAGLLTHPDTLEGVVSFLEKRPPVFTTTLEEGFPDWLPWQV